MTSRVKWGAFQLRVNFNLFGKQDAFPGGGSVFEIFSSLPQSEFAEMEICISQNGNSGEMFQFINTETTLLECHDLTAVKIL